MLLCGILVPLQKENDMSNNALYENLKIAKEDRQLAKQSPELDKAKKAVKDFQVSRIKTTHADFLVSPKTSRATQFFLQELYGSKDMTQRDKDLEKFLPMIEKTFTKDTLEVVTKAVELDALTETLDTKMANCLGATFDQLQYIKAFRQVTSRQERIKQLTLVKELGLSLSSLVKMPFLSTTLKMMAIPAKLVGLYSFHQFLENGFNSFKQTSNPKEFVTTLVSRENQILENIYQEKENPFSLNK